MTKYIIFSLLIMSPLFSQDNIQLPDVELILEDQSALDIANVEDALLKDRNPQFQEVFLEELSANIMPDASLSLAQNRRYNRVADISFSYGSFHDVRIKAFAQNLVNDILYKINYQGKFHENVSENATVFPNTSAMDHNVNFHLSTLVTNTLVALNLAYQQKEQNFFGNSLFNQQNHYVPLDFTVDHWLNEWSHLKTQIDLGLALLQFQDLVGVSQREPVMMDMDVELVYSANFDAWNYFQASAEYEIVYYQEDTTAHQGRLNIISDFQLGKGFSTRIGAELIVSTVQPVYGWPELVLSYDYHNLFTADFKISGFSELFDTDTAFQQNQFFEQRITSEEYWEYSLTLKTKPVNFFWIGTDVAYQTYRAKRLYHFDDTSKLYNHDVVRNADILKFQAVFGFSISNILEFTAAYQYQMIPDTWLLESPHIIDVYLGVGYKPIGFWFETKLSLETPYLVTVSDPSETMILLSFKLIQEFYNRVGIFLEFDNVLNRNILVTQGLYYGGFQVRGGFDIKF